MLVTLYFDDPMDLWQEGVDIGCVVLIDPRQCLSLVSEAETLEDRARYCDVDQFK